ncbi:hypothetical protein N7495_003585 [Penicillium taxi]|uniref:uncharacterized protein n=1 Tax=Penicillium taxi TaxID=168475 RepID=UPI00254566F2|nr:uncharacterized protein N7495_003585 [Penicillium taxi]KAJ5898841.1 hypothetical protein N7495_003585 [Penicillium taxi]
MARQHLSPETRSRICELKRTNGWGARRIKKLAFPDIPISTIHSTLRMEDKRVENHRVIGSGRPFKLNDADKKRLYEAVEQSPDIMIKELLALVDNKIGRDALWRLMQVRNLRKWRKKSQYLKPEHAEKRLQWAREYEHFTPDDWRRVFWSDESTVERGIGARPEWSFISPKHQLDRYEDENGEETSQIQPIPATGTQVKQMFWAAFSGSLRRTPLIALTGDPLSARQGISSRTIDTVLRRYLPTLMYVAATLQELGFIVMKWPPYSPDLNPIENLWALLKAEILRLRPDLLHLSNNESTRQLLIETAKLAWENISFDILEKLAITMPHRVEQVIRNHGWYTKY